MGPIHKHQLSHPSHQSHQDPPTVVQLTPAGRGAVATCQVTGPAAVKLVAPLVRLRGGRTLESLPSGSIAVAQWCGAHAEEIVVTLGADEVVIHCHGGSVPIAAIMADLAAAGGRVTPWQRWAAGSILDPIAAEALIALAHARTERCAGILLDQYQGALTSELRSVIDLLSDGEHATAAQHLTALKASATLGLHLDTPWQAVVSGAPNVGKSTLINALVGYERAIVAAEPGTTRDVVSVSTAVDGWPVELSDTAGIRDTVESLEAAGIALAQQHLAAADLRILVFDRSAPFGTAELALAAAWPDAMIVHSKCDLLPHGDGRPEGIDVCAISRAGVEDLLKSMATRLVPSVPPRGAPLPFRRRHVAAIEEAQVLLKRSDWQEAVKVLEAMLECQGDCPNTWEPSRGLSP